MASALQDPAAELTVFAPDNDAFAAVPSGFVGWIRLASDAAVGASSLVEVEGSDYATYSVEAVAEGFGRHNHSMSSTIGKDHAMFFR